MAERICMICGQRCGFGGFGRLCETCWGPPLRTEDGRMPLSVATQTILPGEKGHRRITVAHAAEQDARVTRYRTDGSVEMVKHPHRRTFLPPGMGGGFVGGNLAGR